MDNAIADFTEAIRLDPKLAQAYYNRGVAYSVKGDSTRPLPITQRRSDSPRMTPRRITTGALPMGRRATPARPSLTYTAAIRLDPKLAKAYCGRANAYDDKGESNKVIDDYNEAIRLNPRVCQSVFRPRSCLREEGRVGQGHCRLHEAIRLNPTNVKAYYGRGTIHLRRDAPDNAIADFTEAIRLDPKSAEAYYGRGYAYQKKGEQARADEDFAQAKKLGFTGK